jgi:DNA-binding LytR/AlgR family response regulator
MIRVAIVEDEQIYQKQFASFLEKYEQEKGEHFALSSFFDGYDVVEKYQASYDIIFLDIQMKTMDGLKTAQKIRERDENVVIIFVTSMAQYAVRGYAVNALDYLVKPVSYFTFSQTMDRAVKKLREKSARFLTITQEGGMIRLDIPQIRYLESSGHTMIVHAESGDYSFRSTMKEMEEKLSGESFVRGNSGYLINLAHVQQVRQNVAVVSGEELVISRPKKKAFMEALTDYLGGK